MVEGMEYSQSELDALAAARELFESLDKDHDGELSAANSLLPGLFPKGQRVRVTNKAGKGFSQSKFEPGDRGTVIEAPEEYGRNCLVMFDDGDSQKVAFKFIAPVFELQETTEIVELEEEIQSRGLIVEQVEVAAQETMTYEYVVGGVNVWFGIEFSLSDMEAFKLAYELFLSLDKDHNNELTAAGSVLPGLFPKGQRVRVTNKAAKGFSQSKFVPGDRGIVLQPPEEGASNCLVRFDDGDAQKVALKFIAPVWEDGFTYHMSQQETVTYEYEVGGAQLTRDLQFTGGEVATQQTMTYEYVVGGVNVWFGIVFSLLDMEAFRLAYELFLSLDKDGDGELTAAGSVLPGLFPKGQRVRVTNKAAKGFSQSKFVPGDRGIVLEPPEEGASNCLVRFDDGDSQKVSLKFIAPVWEDGFNYHLSQPGTMTYEYGMGGTGGGVELQGGTITYEYGIEGVQGEGMQYSGYVAGQEEVAPQQTMTYEYGVGGAQVTRDLQFAGGGVATQQTMTYEYVVGGVNIWFGIVFSLLDMEAFRLAYELFLSLDKDGDGELTAAGSVLPGLFPKGQRVRVTNKAAEGFSQSKFVPGDRGIVLEPPEEGASNCLVRFDDGDSQKVSLKFIAPVWEDGFNYHLSQPGTMTYEYGMGGTGGGVELQGGTITYEYGIEGVQGEGMQYSGYVAGQEEVAPQQTMTYEYGVGGAQVTRDLQFTGGEVAIQQAEQPQVPNPNSVFNTVDADGDGLISRAEFASFQQGMHQHGVGGAEGGAQLQGGTVTYEYGIGGVQGEGMQYSGSVAGQGGVALQYDVPQQTITYEYGVAPQQTMTYEYGVGGVQQGEGMQYTGYVAGQDGVAPQQTMTYEYGVGGVQLGGGVQYSAQPGEGMQYGGYVVEQGGVAPQQTTAYGYGVGGIQLGGEIQYGEFAGEQGGVAVQQAITYGAPQQTGTYGYGVGGVQVGEGMQYSGYVGTAQLGEGMSYSGGYVAGDGGVAYGSIVQPAQVEMMVSENVSVPVTETVTMGMPQQTILTREVGEVGAAAGTVLACEAPSVLCSMSVTETVGVTGVALVTETVTRTEQSLRVRALEAPPPAQAIKVTGVGRYVPVQCQPVFNAVASVTQLTTAVKKVQATTSESISVGKQRRSRCSC